MRGRRMIISGAVAVVAGLAALPGAAQAGVAKVENRPVSDREITSEDVVLYTAGPDEANRVTVTEVGPGQIRVTDAGAPVAAAAGMGCTSQGPNAALCTQQVQGDISRSVEVNTGDRADSVQLGPSGDVTLGPGDDLLSAPAGTSTTVTAGAGNDVVLQAGRGSVDAGPGNDRLYGRNETNFFDGGGGRDQIFGGGGNDTLTDGDGNGQAFSDNEFGAQPVDSDVLDGGRGNDTVSYDEHTTPLTVDLQRTTAGSGGEGDLISGLESVAGGQGDDALRGTSGRNVLEGGFGDDRLSGRGGRDTLNGGDGDDRLDGGSGDDFLLGYIGVDSLKGGSGRDFIDSSDFDGERGSHTSERVSCGSGRDRVEPDDIDLLSRDCELSPVAGVRPIRATLSRITFRVRCPRGAPRRGCRFGLRLATAHRRIGRASVRMGRGRSRNLSVPLTRSASRALRRGRLVLRVRISRTFPGGDVDGGEAAYTIILRR